MEILIDTNIILDWLQNREPFSTNAKRIMEKAIFGNINGYISSHSLCDLFYILRKDFSVRHRMVLINMLTEYLNVIYEDKDDFASVTGNVELNDLEDALQMQCAYKKKVDYIVTRNIADFKLSPIPAILPTDLLPLL